ncbi:predicted protein [Naegleria gruberi]|uniref:Predicted protein n=1 Tax=Naegleria gruberi TaxID=5762 RepID=D2V7M7_NAEGR|nr:uncharacterized protein NAEGRDRAFT_64861 [Naegleria gruberi]EFC47277.1 predicted protein [Naegleria gruberi]|eukprot:XP_002680021.1 predicted protein [Naegleria gruberi strain NEG-M]
MLSSHNNHYQPTLRVRNISSDDFEHEQHPPHHHDEEELEMRTTGEPPHFLKDNFDYAHFEKLALSNVGLKHDEHDDHSEGHYLERSYVSKGGLVVNIPQQQEDGNNNGNGETLVAFQEHSDDEQQQQFSSKLPKVPLLKEMNNTSTAAGNHDNITNKPGRHYFAPVEATREEKLAYVKKVARTLFMIFLVILMSAMVVIDYISNPKNTWVIRLSIFVSMVILWRFLYEYLFEIIFEWILEYLVYKEKKQTSV